MPERLAPSPARAVRRAAIAALSHTSMGGNTRTIVLAAATGTDERQDAAQRYAMELVKAFSLMTNTRYGGALDEMCHAAQAVYAARVVAEEAWTRACAQIGMGNMDTFMTRGPNDPTIAAYAHVSDMTYAEACHELYLNHALVCAEHGRRSLAAPQHGTENS